MKPVSTEPFRVVGMDPSQRNWGIAIGHYNPTLTDWLHIETIDVIQPVLPKGKQVRQNSLDLESAKQLHEAALKAVQGAQAVFIEVPVGSQSARAMCGYGVCIGILGALRSSGIPFFEVTPTEVKLVSVGKKTASKLEMIDWATRKYPEANWPRYKTNGKVLISEAKAEHMADAIAAIHAGIASNPFQQLLPFMKAT